MGLLAECEGVLLGQRSPLSQPELMAYLAGMTKEPKEMTDRGTETFDRRGEEGPFDLIGDIHGCASELESLLDALGYQLDASGEIGQRQYQITPPAKRKAVFVGDLVDRGPRSPDVVRLVMGMVADGTALCVIGNHEHKYRRWLAGKTPKPTHGLAATIEQTEAQKDGFREEAAAFIDSLPTHLVLDRGQLVVAHAGLPEAMHYATGGKVKSHAMFGETTGEKDEYGFPVRVDWAASYRGEAAVVYGHTPVREAIWRNNTICLDTACVFGGKLTALRWPEKELVSIPAEKVWYESRGLLF